MWFFGIDDCAAGPNHDPKPLALGSPLPGADESLLGLGCSSAPVWIAGAGESIVVANPAGAGALPLFGTMVTCTGVLTLGVAMAVVLLTVTLAKPFWIMALISFNCSIISLSPASSLTPGSR